jgi:hypothetical protein
MADTGHRVATACGICKAAHKPCNIFTRQVAMQLGVWLPGGSDASADEIIRAMRHQWRQLTREQAILAAGKGVFIVAGLPSSEFTPRKNKPKVTHGHVCVVIPGKHGVFPRVFSTNDDKRSPYGKSHGEHPLSGFVFTHADASKVQYFAPPLGASGDW